MKTSSMITGVKRAARNIGTLFLVGVLLVPSSGISVVDTATAATHQSTSNTMQFSGYTWSTKTGYAGPGPNYWDNSSNALFTDASGALHMKVLNVNGGWKSSELYLPKSLGYGTYRFEVLGRPDLLDKNLVLGMFLYQDDTREIDIEYSRWGYENGTNMGYSVQPYAIPGNNKSLNITLQNDIPIVHEIIWKPTSVDFRISQNGATLSEWSYTGPNNFVPGKEILDINFWMFNAKAPSDGQEHEVIIKSFGFTPMNSTVTPVKPTEPKPTEPKPTETKADEPKAPVAPTEPTVTPKPSTSHKVTAKEKFKKAAKKITSHKKKTQQPFWWKK